MKGAKILKIKNREVVNVSEVLLLIGSFCLFIYIYENYTYIGFFEDIFKLKTPTSLFYLMPLTTFVFFLFSYIRRLKENTNEK